MFKAQHVDVWFFCQEKYIDENIRKKCDKRNLSMNTFI